MAHNLQNIYDKFPASIQNILLSSYGYYLNFQRYGKKFEKQYNQFQKSQWWDYERLLNYQNRLLRKLIKIAYHTVPFYEDVMKKNNIMPDDIKNVEDLIKLPILTREDIKKNFHKLLSKKLTPLERKRLIKGHTSGTTGTPLEFFWDNNICVVNNVVHWRQKSWAGIKLHEPCAVLLGRTIVPIARNKAPFWRTNYAHNTLWLSSFHMSSDNLSIYLSRLEKFKPEYIEGYPSTLYIFAKYLESNNKRLKLKAVLTSSETLYPFQRETIEQSFMCKIYDYYGLAERVVFATECNAHEGHHLNLDYSITEIVNKNGIPVDDGELGWIVGTGLYNYAMPLIRYKTNDVSSVRTQKCSCGRKFPLLDDVTTKSEDIVTTKDGRFISSSILTHPFKPLVNILQSQIIQEDLSNITIKIIKGKGYKEEDTKYLLHEMQRRVGLEMKIHIEYVDEIPQSKNGKFRWVISKVPLEI